MHGRKINVHITVFHIKNLKYLSSRPGERYASALTNMSLNNKVIKKFGIISLKDYISSFIKDV